jgi:hypothetical protein
MRYSEGSIFIIEYHREYEFTFETALVHESGGPGVLIDEKTEGRKSRETVPLTNGLEGIVWWKKQGSEI